MAKKAKKKAKAAKKAKRPPADLELRRTLLKEVGRLKKALEKVRREHRSLKRATAEADAFVSTLELVADGALDLLGKRVRDVGSEEDREIWRLCRALSKVRDDGDPPGARAFLAGARDDEYRQDAEDVEGVDPEVARRAIEAAQDFRHPEGWHVCEDCGEKACDVARADATCGNCSGRSWVEPGLQREGAKASQVPLDDVVEARYEDGQLRVGPTGSDMIVDVRRGIVVQNRWGAYGEVPRDRAPEHPLPVTLEDQKRDLRSAEREPTDAELLRRAEESSERGAPGHE